jgi:VanZ family protein
MLPQVENSAQQDSGNRSLPSDCTSPLQIPAGAMAALLLLTLCATLVAGLWPFCAPKNLVTWIQDENGIRFGAHGTALSTVPLAIGGKGGACSIELWVKPVNLWKTGSVLTFYNSQAKREFSIEQGFTDLLLVIGSRRDEADRREEKLRIENVFRKRQAFITVTADGQQTIVYVDGHLAAVAPQLALSSRDLAGQIIIATSPWRDHSWSGDLKGLAFYGTALSSAEVREHYQSWTSDGAPALDKNAGAVAVYLFREHSGHNISNFVSSELNLDIPKRFTLVDQLRFESPISEVYSEENYLNNAVINVAGFVPLGFVCWLYFMTVRRIRRTVLITVLIGAAVSLAIEYFQSFLPTRFSGVTDIITNTIGTWIGAMLCRLLVNRTSRFRVGHFIAEPNKGLLDPRR